MCRGLLPPLLAVMFLWPPAGAGAQLDGPIPNAEVTAGTLSFDGHATVGDFVGTTSEVRGRMFGGSGLAAVRGWVEAPVKSLDTRDRKRDKDLNKSMESDKYPIMRFELERVAPEETSAALARVALSGKMLIHGVSREVSIPAQVRLTDRSFRLTADFPLNLKDYKIGGLSKMLGMLRMGEDIEVHLDLTFTPQ